MDLSLLGRGLCNKIHEKLRIITSTVSFLQDLILLKEHETGNFRALPGQRKALSFVIRNQLFHAIGNEEGGILISLRTNAGLSGLTGAGQVIVTAKIYNLGMHAPL